MNKKLIALAVAGACVAPAAMAQTANPVTLYGRVHVTLESVEASGGAAGASPLVRRNRVSDQSSLLGVRGTEDLGGGLKAFFQLETVFKADQNDSTFAARNSGVGLQGSWGSALLGRWDIPYKIALNTIDPLGDVSLGGSEAAMFGAGFGSNNTTPPFNRREQNVVQYWSPNWSGIAFRLSYAANEARTSTLNPRSNGASVTYGAGPVYLAYAYHEFKDQSFAVTPAVTLKKQTANMVAGTYTFGPVKLGAGYEQIKRDGFSKKKDWIANAVYTMGNHQLIYQYQQAKDGAASGTQPDCKVNTPAYRYNFSKRTNVTLQYTKVDNNATSICNFGANQLAISAGQDPKGVSFGIYHVF